MKLYSKEYYDCDQDIRDDYKMHAEKDDRVMNNPEESEKYLIDNFPQNLRERIVELENKLSNATYTLKQFTCSSDKCVHGDRTIPHNNPCCSIGEDIDYCDECNKLQFKGDQNEVG